MSRVTLLFRVSRKVSRVSKLSRVYFGKMFHLVVNEQGVYDPHRVPLLSVSDSGTEIWPRRLQGNYCTRYAGVHARRRRRRQLVARSVAAALLTAKTDYVNFFRSAVRLPRTRHARGRRVLNRPGGRRPFNRLRAYYASVQLRGRSLREWINPPFIQQCWLAARITFRGSYR